MKVQVLVAAMNQDDYRLLEKMNIQTDVIVGNQCNRNEVVEFDFRGRKAKYLSFQEKGVGLNRNNALLRATEEIALFSDEDVTYVDGYEKIICDAFIQNPKADMILFNVPSTNKERPTYIIPKYSKINRFNCLRYGAVKIAVKTKKIREKGLYFSLLFGGGAKYSSGEDNLFVVECLKKGMNIYTCPNIIGYVGQEQSSWFNGYNEKYFVDKGAFFAVLSKKWAKLLCLQFLLRRPYMYRESGMSFNKAYKLMKNGLMDIKGDRL